jgi:hypothetical protein
METVLSGAYYREVGALGIGEVHLKAESRGRAWSKTTPPGRRGSLLRRAARTQPGSRGLPPPEKKLRGLPLTHGQEVFLQPR